VNFGLSTVFPNVGARKEPSIAKRGNMVLAIWGEVNDLKYRLGTTVDARVDFHPVKDLVTGVQASVGLLVTGGKQYGCNLHKSQSGNTLYSNVGPVEGTEVKWRGSHDHGAGVTPSLAVNNSKVVVEVHKDPSNNDLKYRIGSVDTTNNSEQIKFQLPAGTPSDRTKYANGHNPYVAMNNAGVVVISREVSMSFITLRRW
jgi:hypothetical protein